MSHIRSHLSVANTLSCLALFIALSGVAYAATLGKNAVKTKNIARGAVTTPKLKNKSVNAAKLANGAVISVKLANGSVISAKIANGAVGSGKLANGAVTTAKLANNAVGNSKLGADSVTTGKVGDGAVTGAKLSPSLLAQLVQNVSYVTKASASETGGPKTATAECPPGKQVTGGGAFVNGPDAFEVALRESAPVPDGEGKRTGWRATAEEINAEASDWSVEAYAICAEL